MKRILLSLALAVSLSVGVTSQSQGASAQEVRAACSGFEGANLPGNNLALPQDFETGRCFGFFEAFQGLVRYVSKSDPDSRLLGICAPTESRLSQFVLIFADYARRHPSQLHEDATLIAWQALREVWGCQ